MAGIKISQLPAVPSALFTDFFPVVQTATTQQETLQQVATLFGFSNTGILGSAQGGTGVNNAGSTFTIGGNFAMSGAFTFAGTLTGNTAVTFPTSGTLATTSSASGTVNTGLINQLAYYAAAGNAVSGLAIANSASLVTSAAGLPTWVPLSNGQVIIGSTGATPVAANIAAGAGISVSNTAGGITIAATGSGPVGWTDVTGTSQAMIPDGGYVSDNAGLVTLTLPTTAAFGTSINVVGNGAGGWLIAQNAGQNIRIGSAVSTTGVGGSVASTNRYDSLCLICVVANTTWTAFGGPQSSGLTII